MYARIARVFTPSTPVTDAAVFAGRQEELRRLIGSIFEPGRHAVIYGARGVGKTSLANIAGQQLTAASGADETVARFTVRIGCTRDDTYESLWRRLVDEISIVPVAGAETVVSAASPEGERYEMDIADAVLSGPEPMSPALIERVFRNAHRVLFVFDEYDAVTDPEDRAAFADTIKLLSDRGTGATLILVGVGDDIGELIDDHQSVQRCIEQIQMPLMSPDEVHSLIEQGAAALEMRFDPDATEMVVSFSRGFPSFAHSLGKQAAQRAIDDDRTHVKRDDVFAGALAAIESVPYSLGETYKQATDARHPDDRTEVTLVAVAMLGLGRFRPTDIHTLLHEWGTPVSLPTVVSHLRKLASPDRGDIFVQHGDTRPSYEFADPMMAPYVAVRNAGRFPPP